MKKNIPKVSVVILNFNGLQDTVKCLNSLIKTKYPNFEIILIDNGSKINEAVILENRFKDFVKTYRFKKNLGFTGGNNWALKKTTGKYIVLLNNDTKVTPNWLNSLVLLIENDKQIAVVQPKIKMIQRKNYFDYAGAAGGFIDKYGFPFTRGRIFNTQEVDTGQYDGTWPIFWASGSACIIRKSIIDKVGGLFNEDLFNYMEEIDFCWRVWRAGYKVVFTSDSTVYHKVAASASKNVVLKRYWEHRNNLYILIRNLDRRALIKILPARIGQEIVAYVYYFVSRQRPYLKSLFFAHLDFIKHGFFIRLFRKRGLNNDKLPIYPGSIIFDHYLKKKKTFSTLEWSSKGNISYLVFNTSKNTGSEIVFKQANNFIDKGYHVNIFFLLGRKQNWFKLQADCDNFILACFKKAPDVLIATFWPTAYILYFMRAKKKFFFSQDWGPSMHNFIGFKKLAEYAYKLPTKNIVHSKFMESKVKEIGNSNVQKITYCILDKRFRMSQQEKQNSLNRKFYNRRTKVLSVISWYTTVKGTDLLTKVVKMLKNKNGDYSFTLVSREKKPYSKLFDKFISDPPKEEIIKLTECILSAN